MEKENIWPTEEDGEGKREIIWRSKINGDANATNRPTNQPTNKANIELSAFSKLRKNEKRQRFAMKIY